MTSERVQLWDIYLIHNIELILDITLDFQVYVLRKKWRFPHWNLKKVLQGPGWT